MATVQVRAAHSVYIVRFAICLTTKENRHFMFASNSLSTNPRGESNCLL